MSVDVERYWTERFEQPDMNERIIDNYIRYPANKVWGVPFALSMFVPGQYTHCHLGLISRMRDMDEAREYCNDCGEPIYYDTGAQRYYHRDISMYCFLIPAGR